MDVFPLCVPFARKDEARLAGAKWQTDRRLWTCRPDLLTTPAYRQLRPFVPRMYRPELEPPYIRPWMVPQTLWGMNLRALLTRDEWDIVRRHAYDQAGHRCRVCGEQGPEWPVEADEAWDYNDATHVQTLKGVIALCPDCHHVRHWGKSLVEGREEEALQHMMAINRWTLAQAEQAAASAMDQWHGRSRHQWRSDYGWVTTVHGLVPDEAGLARAEASNREVVMRARQAFDEPSPSTRVAPQDNPAIRAADPSDQRSPPTDKRSILSAFRSLFR